MKPLIELSLPLCLGVLCLDFEGKAIIINKKNVIN